MAEINAVCAPLEYFEATDEVRKQIANGCGPGGWKIDLVPDKVLGLSIFVACEIHDFMYAIGTTAQDKHFADRIFLTNMRVIINDNSSFWLLRKLRLRAADGYFLAVSKFGDSAFWIDKVKPAHTFDIRIKEYQA